MKKTNRIFIPDFMIVLKEISLNQEGTMNDIHLKTQITYSHLCNLKKDFVENKWIDFEKTGVVNKITLTESGKQLVNSIDNFFKILEITEDNMYTFRRKVRNPNTKNKKLKKEEEIKND